jgi:antitoxin HigA-1
MSTMWHSLIITERIANMRDEIVHPPIHPGDILLEEFMEPLGLSQNKLAEALDVDPGRINRIVTGKSRITADTALRLARYFGTTPQLWMNLQAKYDLEVAQDEKSEEIERTVHPRLRQEVRVRA